jgi:hypothetical protein
MKRAITLLVLSLLPLRVMASGHGPIFGLATPTNSQGEWSFDQGVFGRSTSVGSQASIRELLGYGLTPHLTLSFTLPVVVGDTRLPPTRIQPGDDFDSTLAWRFQHRATKVGTRIESTAFAGLVVPGPQSAFNGVANTSNVPGFMVGAVTGRASLSHYVWLGATFTKFGDHDGNQRPDVFDYSFVYGYRPPKWRRTPDNGTGDYSGNWWASILTSSNRQTRLWRTRSAPSLSRPFSPWNLSQLHDQLWCPVPDLSGRRCRMAEGACAFRSQFQLSAIPALTLGR